MQCVFGVNSRDEARAAAEALLRILREEGDRQRDRRKDARRRERAEAEEEREHDEREHPAALGVVEEEEGFLSRGLR